MWSSETKTCREIDYQLFNENDEVLGDSINLVEGESTKRIIIRPVSDDVRREYVGDHHDDLCARDVRGVVDHLTIYWRQPHRVSG